MVGRSGAIMQGPSTPQKMDLLPVRKFICPVRMEYRVGQQTVEGEWASVNLSDWVASLLR